MAEMSVAEYAALYRISPQLVRRAARDGSLRARKSGSTWLIDDGVRYRPAARRPLGVVAADAVLAAIDGRADVSKLRPTERTRLGARLGLLRDADADPADLLRDWMRPRFRDVERYFAQPEDLPDLVADNRVVPGGVSDPRAQISAPQFAELHVADADVEAVRRAFLLRRSGTPNVALHVHERLPARPLPLSQLVLDLAADDGPREHRRVAELVRGIGA